VAGATRAEEGLAPSAEDGAHVGALARLEQDDDDQEEARQHVDRGDDVIDQDACHLVSSAYWYCTIRVNAAGSRLAPPTSAPSMWGSAMSASMLSGFTLPP